MLIRYNYKIINNFKFILTNFNRRYFNTHETSSLDSPNTTSEESHTSEPDSTEDLKFNTDNCQNKNVKLVEYTFNWGIGNKFIEQSQNRIRPTHKKKVTTVTIPSNYFEITDKFENCKVVFDEVNEQWEVLWLEYNKLNGKPFPVKKYGIQSAKLKSLEFATSLNEKLNNTKDSNNYTSTDEDKENKKILFDNILQCWVGLGRVGGRPIARAYSADYHGFENSKQLSKNLNKS